MILVTVVIGSLTDPNVTFCTTQGESHKQKPKVGILLLPEIFKCLTGDKKV